MRRALHALAVLAGLVWGGMFGWAIHSPETKVRTEVRTVAFVVMFGAALMPAPARRSPPGTVPEEKLAREEADEEIL